MKISHIALAVAAIGASPAFAATVSLGGVNVDTNNLVYISGASALSGSLAAVVAKNCTVTVAQPSPVKSLTVGGSASAGRVTVCTTSSIDGQFTGPFAVVKRDTNGSFDGVAPVILQTGLTGWAKVGTCTASNCDIDAVTLIAPHAGLTDVDTNVWVGMSNTGALSLPVPALDGNTTASGGFAGQGFGIMASEKLYNAMMVKQVAEGRLPSTCVAGNFTAGACQPSISKEEYAAVVDSSNFAYVANGALTGDTNPINLCKRVETSGTQAVSNVYFLNNSCSAANVTGGFRNPKAVDLVNSPTAVAFATTNITGNYDDFGGAFGLFEGSGTGDARNCVINRNNGQNPNKVADTLGNYAIGFLSLENAPASGWKLLKLDGVSPNAYQVPVGSTLDVAGGGAADGWAQDSNQRINVVKGYYDLSPELEMLWPTATPFATFFGTMKSTFADPTAVNTRGIFQANGTSTHAANPTQVHKGTRGGNFCAPQTLAE